MSENEYCGMGYGNSISEELLKLVMDYNEVENSMTNVNPIISETFKEVYTACRKHRITKIHKLKIDSIADYLNEELYTGHWNSIPLAIKKSFFTVSFIKAIVLLHLNTTREQLQEVLKVIDMGILLGAPLENNHNLLTNSAAYINKEIIKTSSNIKFSSNINSNSDRNKRKLQEDFLEYDQIKSIEIASLVLPSLESFMKNYFYPKIPLKIQESISHWPAIHKWPDITYLLKMCGERTVPIEIGSQYSDQNWSQKIMTFKTFIEQYYHKNNDKTAYFAQHNLFDQIPELKDDICIPEYCNTNRDVCNEPSTVEINAWLGPEGTISSLHYDPKDNLLAQVYGTKQIIMFSPNDTEYLYPHESLMLCNTSQLNPLHPDLQLFPKFTNAKMLKCLLQEGEVLYIPPKWWHYVTALENSCSVNFWWT